MRFSFDLRIQAPRTAVFDFLGDPEQRPRWQTSIKTLELESEGPPGIGVRWQESVRGAGTFRMEISEFERPTRWAERLESQAFSGTVAMTFAEDGDATVLTLDADVRCHGLLRHLDPLGRIVLRREMRKDLSRVEALLAAGGARGTSSAPGVLPDSPRRADGAQ
jgi:carbon monoxide dehydrogenase subunit G